MANFLYTKFIDKILNPGTLGTTSGTAVDLIDDIIRGFLVNTVGGTVYTANAATDEYLSIIPVAARVGTAVALGGKTLAGGVFDANDMLFLNIAAGAYGDVEALVLYKDSGTETTSPLIAYIDTATGLPFTPNGGNITIAWDNGANRIFKVG
jgi:alpha-glucosidase (family GH31 glycosyl hydrolase)